MVQVFNINGNRKKQKKKKYIYIQEITKPHNFVNKSFALQKYEIKSGTLTLGWRLSIVSSPNFKYCLKICCRVEYILQLNI